MQTVFVVPAASGWMVRSDAIDNEQFFTSGAAAEAAALKLAETLAAKDPAEIKVLLPDGTLARRFAVPVGEKLILSPGWRLEPHAA